MGDRSPLRIGVIGLGKMGVLHSGIFNALPDVQVCAVCESEPFLLGLLKTALPKMHFYSDYRRMLRDETLDAAVLTTPIHSHAAMCLTILETRPLHLFVEKPLASSVAESEDVRRAAEAAGIVTMVGYMKRHNPVFLEAKRLLDSKILGECLYFRAHSFIADIFSEGRGWRFKREGGGALFELGPHLLDLLLWFFGEPSNVVSVMKQYYSREVDDYCHVSFVYPEGFVGHADISWSARGYRLPETSIEVHGSNGTIAVTDDYLRIDIDKPRREETLFRASFGTSVPFLLGDPEYCAQAERFVECIRSRTQTETSFRVASRVDALLAKISGEAVRVGR